MLRSRQQEPQTLVDELSAHGAPSAFGQYRVLHQIGSGVLGPVFRSFDPQRDRIVAVKAFKLDLLPEDVARLAAALRRLVAAGFRHQHHVELIDAGLEGTTPFLVLEYVSGETLDVARRQLAAATAAAVLPWLQQLAAVMDEAKRAGLRHGSLHPRDVMISGRNGEVRVTGVGIADALESVGARVPVRRPYTAPERTSGDPWDARADVYSLAAIAHELLTGRRPAGAGEQDGALSGGFTPEQRVAVRKVLATGLAERPEARFDSASSFVQAVEVAVSGGQPALPVVPVESRVEAHSDTSTPTVRIPVPPITESQVDEPRDVEPQDSEAQDLEPQLPAPQAPDLPAVQAPMPPPSEPALPVLELRVSGEPAVRPSQPAPVPAPVNVAPIGLATDISHRHVSIRSDPGPLTFIPPSDPAPYPWLAIAAAGLAGLVLGGVLGYRAGITQNPPTAAATAAKTPAPGASDTEVAVGPRESAPPPAAQPQPVSPTALEPRAERTAVTTGQLRVQSDPAGALVTVDGQYRGETPVTIRDLPLGAYTVQIARPGHIPWSNRVTLTSASPARVVAAELQPGLDMSGRVTGSMYIDSRPRGARVMIDGRFVGTTPFRVPGLAAGRHEIRLELDGYRAATQAVQVTPGRESRVAMTLDPAALPGGRGPQR